jgi:hypothetical protein
VASSPSPLRSTRNDYAQARLRSPPPSGGRPSLRKPTPPREDPKVWLTPGPKGKGGGKGKEKGKGQSKGRQVSFADTKVVPPPYDSQEPAAAANAGGSDKVAEASRRLVKSRAFFQKLKARKVEKRGGAV